MLLSKFLNKLGSFGHNLGSRNARKSIKGSKDSYSSLKTKQSLSHNIDSCLGDDIINDKPKKAKHTLALTTPTENPKPKSRKLFFQSKLEDFTSLSRV